MYLVGFPQMQQSCSLSEIITSAFISILSSLNNSFNDSLSPHWNTKQTIMTNPSNGTTYTCTEDCWIQLQVNGGNNSIGISLTINENNISAIGGANLFIIFPPVRCKKNDVIKFNSWGATPNELYVYKFN